MLLDEIWRVDRNRCPHGFPWGREGNSGHEVPNLYKSDCSYLLILSDIYFLRGFPGDSMIKNRPPMQEPQKTGVWSLGQEDPLEEGMATHSSILAWRISWTEEPGELQSKGSQRVGQDWSNLACMHILLRNANHRGNLQEESFVLNDLIEEEMLGGT